MRYINKYLGWRNWAVLNYNSVIENIFLALYIALRSAQPAGTFIPDLFAFFLFSVFSTTYGYLVNDLADKDLDALHGKQNTFGEDSKTKASLITLLALLFSIAFAWPFVHNPLFLPVWICWAFLTTFYSLPPLRFKVRGRIGLLLVVFAQRLFPAIIIFLAFQYYDWVDILTITFYIFCRGISSDVHHQLEDYHKDRSTGTETYAVKAGLQKTERLLRVALETEKILLIICLLVMTVKLAPLRFYAIPLMLPLFLSYLLLYGANLNEIMTQGTKADVNPFVAGRKNLFQIIHHGFPSVAMPLYLLLLLTIQDWLYVPVLLLFIVFRKLYSLKLLRSVVPVCSQLSISKAKQVK